MKKEDVEIAVKPEEKIAKKKVKEAKEPKVKKMSSDAKVIFGIIAVMVLICAALITYYYGILNKQTIATFDGKKVTRGEYEVYYKVYGQMLAYYGYDEEAIKEEVLNKIVIDKIILEKAEEEDVTLSEDEIKEIDEVFADEEQVNSYIEQGIDPDKMRDIYETMSIYNAYVEKITSEATEEKIKAFIDETEKENATYGKYNASYILYAVTGEDADKDAVKAEAQKTLDRLKNGEDFATVGEEVQEANSTTVQYGADYSAFLNGSSVVSFENALRSMKVGEMTQQLVESEEYGYFIIKLNSIDENARVSGDEAAENYASELIYKWQKDADLDINEKRLNKVFAKLTETTSTSES